MPLSRRTFLQHTGWGLAGLGLSERLLDLWSQRYQQALAAPAPRKWALLIGINDYAAPTHWPALQGCLTDLALQEALLVHRFGFSPQHILTLANQAATRTAIESAFVSHLVEQAGPEDVVVVHFSGYGSRVTARPASESSELGLRQQNLLLPVDAVVELNGSDRRLNGLLEDTLFLLLRSLPTDRVTTILDVGFAPLESELGGGIQVRSQPLPEGILLSEAALAFRAELLQQTELSPEQVSVQRRSGQLPGIFLSANSAVEAHWPHTQAGLLTYWLTQRLWNAMPAATPLVTFSRIATALEQQVGASQPFELQGQKSYETPLLGYGDPQGPAADGVLLGHEDASATPRCWLGGLPPHLLAHVLALGFNTPALDASPPLAAAISTPSADPPPPTEGGSGPAPDCPAAALDPRVPVVVLQKRPGLMAAVALTQPDTPLSSPFLQEALRQLPRALTLQVALGKTLNRMERVDATSAFSSVTDLAVVPSEQRYADVLLSRVNLPAAETAPEGADRYALFHHSGTVYANTVGEPGEAIKTAVRRLSPQIEVLLAAKALNLTVNDATAQVGVSTTLELLKAEDNQTLIHQYTPRAPWLCPPHRSTPKAETQGKIVTLSQGSHIQYRIQNFSPFPLYLLILGVDPSPDHLWCYAPSGSPDSSELSSSISTVVPPQETLTLPKATTEWLTHGPPGLATTYFLFARQPWPQTQPLLSTQMRQSSQSATAFTLRNPWSVVQSVLADLHQASVAAKRAPDLVSDQGWLLDVQQWATLAFVYRIA